MAVVAGGTRNDQNGAFALINFVDTFRVVSSDTINSVTELPAGKVDQAAVPEDTNFTIVVVDDNGEELTSLPMVEFSTIIADGDRDGAVLYNAGGTRFGASLPYPPEAARLQIHKQGQIIADIDPLSKSLRDLIERIPDRGLKKPPANRRKSLLHKVDAFETTLAHNKRAALNKLDSDIQAHIEKWVLDFDPLLTLPDGRKIYPYVATRDDVLTQIERVRERIEYRMK